MMRIVSLALLAAMLAATTVSAEESKPAPGAKSAHNAAHHVILCGSGGEAEYSPKFRDWGTRLKNALVTKCNVAPENVALLMEPENASIPASSSISLETIQTLFKGLAASVTPEDDVFIYLIGHGSFLKNTSKFEIPGPDLSAEAFEAMLAELSVKHIVVVDGTSASAGFINVISGPNRIVCSATKSATEVNATEFMRFFVEALEDGSADRNRDERISVREVCEQAATLTASWYTTSTLIATEHALLDDNGDHLGTRLPIDAALGEAEPADPAAAKNPDGSLADSIFIKNFSFPPNAPQPLIDSYLASLDEVKALRGQKSQLPEAEYYKKLEAILLEAARTHREIRGYAGKPAPAEPAAN